jgi:hypothetical protein
MTTAVDEQDAPPADEPRPGRTPEGSAQSCRNAIRDGCRSLKEFPATMQQRIDAKEAELIADLKPTNALERILITEIARATIKVLVCEEELSIDHDRLKEKGDSEWDADRRREVNNLAVRLPRDSRRVAHALEETLHGAEFCLESWRDLGASVAQNGGLTEPQRQLACDLMGISPLSRDNFSKVPACDDKQGLLALVTREVKRLETKIILELKGRDNALRVQARRGLSMPPDATTRRIKSNESRATKRLTWSIQTFNQVRWGLAPDTIIDPATKQPLRPEREPKAATPASAPPPRSSSPPPPAGAAEAAPPAPEALGDQPQPPGEPAGREDPIPLPDGAAGEDAEALLIMGATLRSLFRQGLLKPPPLPDGMPGGSQAPQS